LEGNREEAIERAEQAVATSRETGIRFAGPMSLGTLALVADDADSRKAALDEGEAILLDQCVSHNYLWFYRDAIETCLGGGDWEGVRKFAAAAEGYTRDEPLPWMDLLIDRGRALADIGQGTRDGETVEVLTHVRDEADRVGFKVAIPALDEALAAVG
jgi:hypothetical protein